MKSNDGMTDILLVEPNHNSGINPYPWGVLSVGSWLKSRGFSVELLVGSYMTAVDFEKTLNRLLPTSRMVGISCFTTDASVVKEIVDEIKVKFPGKKVVIGGPHAILRPETVANYSGCDFAVVGPGEKAMEGLLREELSGNRDYNLVSGIAFRADGRVHFTPAATDIPDYAIDHSLLPENKRKVLGNYAEILAGRGCSFKCAFCYNAVCGHKWQGKSAEALVEEVQGVVDEFDPEYIYFRDENFFHSKKRVHDFIRLYRERGFRFRWDATCRANYFTKSYVNEALLNDLESINCQRLKFGIESGSQRVLDLLKKGTKLPQIRHVVELLSKSGIIGNYSFLMGVPGEIYAEYKKTMHLIRYILDVDPGAEIIGPQYYRIYPGGELYEDIMRNYPIKEPRSFEEWAEAVRGDYFGLNKQFDYPWVVEKDLPRYADLLTLLARKPLGELLSPLKFPALPFALLARLRMRVGWYGAMWDLKLAAYLFKRYVKSFYAPRALEG